MKVFISYSHADKMFADKLANRLKADNIQTWLDRKDLFAGEVIIDRIKHAISMVDIFIVILSKKSVESSWVSMELSAVLLNEQSAKETIIIPILIEDCEIPYSLSDRLYADFRKSFEDGYSVLLKSLKENRKQSFTENLKKQRITNLGTFEYQINSIQKALLQNELVIFCGSGISYDSGIPTWANLLKDLLKEAFNGNPLLEIENKLAEIFQKRQNLSPLIIAKYLKILLEKKFIPSVRNVLYANYKGGNKIISSIANISKPWRDRSYVKGIVTFNFDDLIEQEFDKYKIKYKTIYTEGERPMGRQIPIYHPHGYLPQNKKLDNRNFIVFSEDAYHEQFIDSFSWNNLIQLNYLNNYTCLFVGISLTDPNMRRLLDVIHKRRKDDERIHYIIKKHYTIEELFETNKDRTSKNKEIIPIIENIEEQDAKQLGFNMIWVNEFTDVPILLDQIASVKP